MNAYTFWKELDTLSDTLLNPAATPKVDVVETKDRYELIAELPGFQKDQVTVQVKDGVLELTATAPSAATPGAAGTDETRWLVRERRQSSFQRLFRLPRDVDGDSIDASFRDGLLVLTLPKKEEAKPRVVTIKAA